MGGSIEKMTVTDSGVLLITHGKGLAGIKPGQKELVFNLLGETLISMKTNAKEIEVDLSALPSATYFVKIISDGRGKVVKVNKY